MTGSEHPSLAHSAARGTLFTLGAQVAKIVLQLTSVVTLSRLLTPHDYGLVAVVLVIIGIGEIFRDFGLTSASVQAPSLSNGQRDNLFWINSAIGLVLASVMFGLSWPVSLVMREAELLPIVQVLSMTMLLNGLTTQYRAQLMRALRFREMALIDIVAATIALGSAIVAALIGAAYWALVLQQIVNCSALLVGALIAGRWIPRHYSRKHDIRGFIKFGWNLVAANLVSYAGNQIDTILVALRAGATPLGLYNRAYQLITTPLSQTRAPLSNVAIPVLSRTQGDTAKLNTFVTSGQLALGYTLGVPLLLISGLADPVVHIMLGPQWTGAVPILRLFALSGLLTTLAYVGYWVYVSRGLGRQLFHYTLVSLSIRILCVSVGSFFGLIGVAAGVTAAAMLAWPLSIYWLSRITPFPRTELWAGAGRVLAAASAAGAVAWLTSASVDASPWLSLLAGMGAGLAIVACFLILPAYRRDAQSLLRFARLMLKR